VGVQRLDPRAEPRGPHRANSRSSTTGRNKFLALGFFDPESPIRVRILHAGKPVTLDTAWWRARLATAMAKRTPEAIGPDTDGYRLINGESDGWPGLVLDRYAGTLALKLYAAAWLPRLGEISALIREALSPEHLILRLSRNIQDAARDLGLEDGVEITEAGQPASKPAGQNLSPTGSLAHSPAASVIFRESGLRFEAEVVRGQKTGFFLDQRDNRRLVETLAHGAEVLNAFSFCRRLQPVRRARGREERHRSRHLAARAGVGQTQLRAERLAAGVATAAHEQIQGTPSLGSRTPNARFRPDDPGPALARETRGGAGGRNSSLRPAQ
jgi:23S rRNA (cytosine1962-C5)-methyltransferase